jgi:fibronectin type 3 domain-containing protein
MGASIAAFDGIVRGSWNGAPAPVVFCTQLSSANSHLGSELLSPTHYSSVLLELDGLKALGVRGISLSVNYPLLHPSFYADQAQYQQYLEFYRKVANDVRTRGLKLVVESRIILGQDGPGGVPVQQFYDSLTIEQYQTGRMETVRTIALEMRPDYISVITEPDTEAWNLGKPEVGTVSGSTALLQAILNGVRGSGVQGVALGAGVGTWQLDYLSYIQSFAATSVDYIDIHVYPVNKEFLTRAIQIADTARSYGKKVTMSEAWLHKIRDSELWRQAPLVTYARDVFSFWAPLDIQFLETLVRFSHFKQLDFMTAFFGAYFRAQLTYDDSTKNLSPMALNLKVGTASYQNMTAGIYTSIGLAYEAAILPAPDTVPPYAPEGVSATTKSASSIAVAWQPGSDNVGPAGYKVYRNGAQVASTAFTSLTDTDLTDGTAYTYTVTAFDAVGNTSPASTPASATTTDRTPPTVPAGLTAQAVSTKQIDLTWQPSTDNVGVKNYKVYKGSSASSLYVIATVTGTSYSNSNHAAGTTYYYAVAASDANNNISAQCTPVAVTTQPPDTTPPSVPANLTGSAVSPNQVNLAWSPSTDNVAVTGYKVYRGNSQTNMYFIGQVTSTAYSDLSTAGNKTYYYAVAANDARNNTSEKSAAIPVTTPR